MIYKILIPTLLLIMLITVLLGIIEDIKTNKHDKQ